MSGRRRTVIYLKSDDYEYLHSITSSDDETYGRSFTKLLRWLRDNGVWSVQDLVNNARIEGVTDLTRHELKM